MQNRLCTYGFKDPISNKYIKIGGNKMQEDQKEWKKVETELVKFENIDDTVEGVLLEAEIGGLYGNIVYKIKANDGKLKTVFSTLILESLMGNVKIGSNVKIVFTGTQENRKKGQNDIKLFDVFTQ